MVVDIDGFFSHFLLFHDLHEHLSHLYFPPSSLFLLQRRMIFLFGVVGIVLLVRWYLILTISSLLFLLLRFVVGVNFDRCQHDENSFTGLT